MNKLRLLGIIAFLSLFTSTRAQLAGTFSVPATYSTIGAAINALNTQGVNGPVTILISAGHTETAVSGGYSLTATGTATSPITFVKSGAGANPVIYAYSTGFGTPNSAIQDGVLRLIGSDYITIDGLTIIDPNTTNPNTMEFGIGLFKANSFNGCLYNTIRNCVIQLNRENTMFGSGPARGGSRGIDVVDATTDAHTTYATITNSAGTNSYNKIQANLIENCNVGVSMIGYFNLSGGDLGNEVGGPLAANGNTIINWGGGTSPNSEANAVFCQYQFSVDISNNLINNNTGTGVNHNTTIRGIYLATATNGTISVTNNTVTAHAGSSLLYAIFNSAGSSPNNNTVTISNNLITDCDLLNTSSTTFYGIYNSANPFQLSITSNSFVNNTSNGQFGSWYNIYQVSSGTNKNISNNLINMANLTYSTSSIFMNGIYNISGNTTSTLSMNSNTLQGLNTQNHSGQVNFIYNGSTHNTSNASNNVFKDIVMNSTSTSYLIYNGSYNTNMSNNQIVGSFNRPNAFGTQYGIFAWNTGAAGSSTVSNNNFSNLNFYNGTTFYGIYHFTTPNQALTANNNTIANVFNGGFSSTLYGMYVAYPQNLNNNLITNINNSGTTYGMQVAAASNSYVASGNTISAMTSTNSVTMYGFFNSPNVAANFTKNKIYDLSVNFQFGSGTLYGVYLQSGNNYTVSNNMIGDLRMPFAFNTTPLYGIYIAGGSSYRLFYNTVHLNAQSNSGFFGSVALFASTTPQLELRNNIFINLSTPSGGANTIAYRRSSNSIANYISTSNNNIFYAGTPGPNNLIYFDGTNSHQTLAAYQAFVTPRDANSFTENTPFLSLQGTDPMFLHVNPSVTTVAESGGTNVGSITDDIDGNIRQGNPGYVGGGTAPDIGADEFELNAVNCSTVAGGSITPNPAYKCNGQSVSLNVTGFTAANGISYQWMVSNTPGGPYTNVVGGVGANYAPTYVTPTLGTGTYYYVMTTSCSISNATAVSQEGTVTIQAPPSITVTPATPSLCLPGAPPAMLTGSGAATYTWLPFNGIQGNNVGQTVSVLPSSTTVYTVTGTNLGGCSTNTTVTVDVFTTPIFNAVGATPTLVCSAGNSSLEASGSVPGSYSVTNVTYSPVPTPSTGVTTLASNGNASTPLSAGNLDNGSWNNIPLPFSFNFYGTTYNSIAVGTNGYMVLGGIPNTLTGYGFAFPSVNAARPVIAPVYADLMFYNPGSTINVFSVGTAPNRRFVVNWTNGQFFAGGGTGTVTSQAILYENGGFIEAHIGQSTGNSVASEVVQNALGTQATPVAGRNNAIWSVNTPEAHRWYTGAVNYSWTPNTFLNQDNISNPVASTVTTGITYTVTIMSPSGCTNFTTLTLAADNYPNVNIAGSQTVCSANGVSFTASGAATYSWNTGATTALMTQTPAPGNYTYVVSGFSPLGCETQATRSVVVYATPTVMIAGPSTVCSGAFANLSASGANSYSWSNGSGLPVIVPSPTTTTTYSVVGTSAAGCSSTAAKTVSVMPLPQVTITALPGNTICAGESANLVASGTGVDSYSWSTGATSAFINVSPTANSSYSVMVANNTTGCTNVAQVFVSVLPCVGLKENSSALNTLQVYPNPNSGQFTIQLGSSLEMNVEMSDVTGRIVYQAAATADNMNIDISALANGVYYVKVQSGKDFTVLKVVKQ